MANKVVTSRGAAYCGRDVNATKIDRGWDGTLPWPSSSSSVAPLEDDGCDQEEEEEDEESLSEILKPSSKLFKILRYFLDDTAIIRKKDRVVDELPAAPQPSSHPSL